MVLIADGVTPVPRMFLLDGFLLRPDFRVELDGPLFVAAGDRLSHRDGALVLTRPTGEQRRYPVRDAHSICRR
ncbi:hypothetical protein [Kitasatospora sp. NPDC088134]|uniref:hypothetical protein n=1 Tax=Kitasatospora sp. NPDC088134 TaxID=3364071 RepID=UPI003816D2E4